MLISFVNFMELNYLIEYILKAIDINHYFLCLSDYFMY